jgi:hypothetical protein
MRPYAVRRLDHVPDDGLRTAQSKKRLAAPLGGGLRMRLPSTTGGYEVPFEKTLL